VCLDYYGANARFLAGHTIVKSLKEKITSLLLHEQLILCLSDIQRNEADFLLKLITEPWVSSIRGFSHVSSFISIKIKLVKGYKNLKEEMNSNLKLILFVYYLI